MRRGTNRFYPQQRERTATMFRTFLIVISILSVLPTGLALGGNDSLQISIENRSAFPILLQVRDEVCKTPVSDACTQADFITKSRECRKTPQMDACVRAQEKIDGGSCVEGLIYEGSVEVNGKISLSICANPSGYGRLSMRDLSRSRNTLWKSNVLISNGERLSWP
jgi:hypothetical protein